MLNASDAKLKINAGFKQFMFNHLTISCGKVNARSID